jgi:hypothetical protein
VRSGFCTEPQADSPDKRERGEGEGEGEPRETCSTATICLTEREAAEDRTEGPDHREKSQGRVFLCSAEVLLLVLVYSIASSSGPVKMRNELPRQGHHARLHACLHVQY